jgi:sortase B
MKKNKKKKTCKIISLMLIIAISLSLLACGTTEIETEPPPETMAPPTEPPVTEPPLPYPPVMLPEYVDWWERNNDMVGWLYVGDLISEPVLQADDNDFYLDHNFDKEPRFSGAIAADYKNTFDGYNLSDNTLLYGHNMKDGRFFKPLERYYTRAFYNSDLSFYKENPVVQFNSLFQEMEWKVFGVVLYSTQPSVGEVVRFWEYIDFDGEDEFHDYILEIMDRSVIFTDVDIEYGDKILSLMTCWYPDGLDCRIVVHARQVRPGESSEVDVSKATLNKVSRVYARDSKWIGEPGAWDAAKYLTSYRRD